MSASVARGVQRKHEAAPVALMSVAAAPGERTMAHGALWDGVLNATPDDDTLTTRLSINRGNPEELPDAS